MKDYTQSRRKFLTAAGSAAMMLAASRKMQANSASTDANSAFPGNFRWGVATAAHQIEGNNTNSDFWLLENIKPTTFADRSGDACDSYHRYQDDIALLATLGFNTYRFSIEWARIEPSRGFVSLAELDHYKRVIECCHRHRITPVVTFFHCTAPIWFAQAGGWLNPDSSAWFAHYCSVAAKALADGMEYALTINEPQVAKVFRSIPGTSGAFAKRDQADIASHAAAAKATGCERFVTMNHPDIDGMTPQLLAAHEKGYAAIKAERSALPVGVTLNVVDFQPATEESPYMEVRKRAYGEWFACVRKAGDFTGAQIYRQFTIPGSGKPLPKLEPLPYLQGEGRMASFSRPEAVFNALEYVYQETQKPILITENGIETENDLRRLWYIDQVMPELKRALDHGIPLLGYLHWSLIDNFEWTQGFKVKYGLASVDRTTFERKAKPSGVHLGEIARRNAI